jgi:hypothetical protein
MNRRGSLGLQIAHVWRALFGDDDVLEPGAAQKIIANLRHGGPYAVKNNCGTAEVNTLGQIRWMSWRAWFGPKASSM